MRTAYLDMNQWVYLARDYWGRPGTSKRSGIATRILESVESGNLRLPLSTDLFIEHHLAHDAERRARLAEVFDRFSGGWYMAAWTRMLPGEIEDAVFRTFNSSARARKHELFGRGYLYGLSPAEEQALVETKSSEFVEFIRGLSQTPGAVFQMLTMSPEGGRQTLVSKVRELGTASAAAAEDVRLRRQGTPDVVSRHAQYAGYTLEHQDLIAAALDRIKLRRQAFLSLDLPSLEAFWRSVPSLDVDCELTLYRDRQRTRAVQANDVRDLGHLVLAIPYCDMVVTEKFWVRAASETGLGSKYATAVVSDLGALVD